MKVFSNPAEARLSKCALLGAIAGFLLLSVDGSKVRAEDAIVKIENFAFTPDVLTVKVGTQVVFVNEDDIPHSVVESSA